METVIKLSRTAAETARDLADDLATSIRKRTSNGEISTVALSGGSTPAMLFTELASRYKTEIDWNMVHFFWGDERCVPPDSPESNYGNAAKLLFGRIEIPDRNIHRIRGEEDAEKEAERYSREIASVCSIHNKLPVFDFVILGLGEDGHTASIFPGSAKSFSSSRVCEVAVHPGSGQRRITITGSVINNAAEVIFMVTGPSKAEIVSHVIESPGISEYPSAYVEPVNGTLKWFLDLGASSRLCQWA
jgi:6-phosphogluconolactonase